MHKLNKLKDIGVNVKSKRLQRYMNAGLLNKIDDTVVEQAQTYWENYYGKNIDPVLHLAFFNLTGLNEPRIIPPKEMWQDIIPFLNDMRMKVGYSDKNIYDKLICGTNAVETVLKRVRGNYFNLENESVARSNVGPVLLNCCCDMIIKPSNTDNGVNVRKLRIDRKDGLNLEGVEGYVGIEDLERIYGPNFIVQKAIMQHSVMATPHPPSVNTLRMVTLRWDNEIKHLMTFARFGCHGNSTDNAGTGGLCVGITDGGEFMDVAIDKDAIIYTHHPTTNYCFGDDARVPNFERFKEFVVDLHKDILHHDFVSWDIAVGLKGQPIFLEANFMGATWLYQLACQKPMFGDLTKEILQRVGKSEKYSRDISPLFAAVKPGYIYTKRYTIHGKVQGVGFRKWIKRRALASNLNGHCRFLKNGRVEVVVAGTDKAQVDSFKNDCFKGPRRAQVINVIEEVWDKPVENGFVVKKTEAEIIAAKLKEMKMQNRELKKRVSEQASAYTKIKKKYNKIKQSRIWRYSKPLRETVKFIKSVFAKAG